ncbi:MAG: PAS domain S-box protein, partial [Anaerolineae bacterium]
MTLHILHLEDNPTDAELAQAMLEADGIECAVTRVETRADFLAAVEQGGFDLILADYSLPSFDGLAALEIARKQRPEVPFIFLSGILGEEVAIESLKSGARDYVLKERVSRLAPSVRRALREAEERTARQRAEEAQRASEKRFRALIENSSDGIVLLSAEATILYDSPAVTQILGYAPDERIGRNVFEFIHPDERQTSMERFARFAQQPGAVINSQGRFRHKDGSWRWTEGVRSNLLDQPGVQAIVVNYRDVIERVRAEQRLAAQYAVARCLIESRTLADAVPKILQAICASLEWDHGEVWSALWSPDSQANVLRCVGTWQPPSPSFPEFEAVTRQIEFAPGIGLPGRVWASGEPVWIPDVIQDANFLRAPIAAKEGLRASFAFPLKPDGEVLGVMGFFSREIRQPDNDLLQMFTSISNQISQFIERKRAEESLKETEAQLKALIDNTGDTIWSIDTEYRLTSTNATFRDGLARFIGREISNGESVFTGISQNVVDEWTPLYARALGGETCTHVSISHGGWRGSMHRETFFNPIRGQDDKVVGVACFSRDIT